MRITLEKADLVKVLSKHFNENFDPERVSVRAEPFEVTLHDIPLTDEVLQEMEGTKPAAASSVQASSAPTPKVPEAPPPPPSPTTGVDHGLSPQWIVTRPTLPSNDFERPVGGNASHVPPPYNITEETSGEPASLAKNPIED